MKKFLMTMMVTALAAPMFAQTTAPSRIAVINVQEVLAASSAGKASIERLKKMQEDRVARGQKMSEELKNITSEIESKKLSLSDEKVAELQKKATDKQLELQRFGQDAEREVTEARDKALADLERQIMPVINAMGKEMGFAVIFNKFESGLVYASDAVDITSAVIKRFNEAPAAAAPAAKPAK
jgi:outer membrane protein